MHRAWNDKKLLYLFLTHGQLNGRKLSCAADYKNITLDQTHKTVLAPPQEKSITLASIMAWHAAHGSFPDIKEDRHGRPMLQAILRFGLDSSLTLSTAQSKRDWNDEKLLCRFVTHGHLNGRKLSCAADYKKLTLPQAKEVVLAPSCERSMRLSALVTWYAQHGGFPEVKEDRHGRPMFQAVLRHVFGEHFALSSARGKKQREKSAPERRANIKSASDKSSPLIKAKTTVGRQMAVIDSLERLLDHVSGTYVRRINFGSGKDNRRVALVVCHSSCILELEDLLSTLEKERRLGRS